MGGAGGGVSQVSLEILSCWGVVYRVEIFNERSSGEGGGRYGGENNC